MTTDRLPWRIWLILAFAVSALTLLSWWVLGDPTGQQLDEEAMASVVAGRDTKLRLLSILGNIPIAATAVAVVGTLVGALLRRELALVVGAVVVLVGSNVTTQLLKHEVLERASLGFGVHNSLPSGHVTLIMSGCAALILVGTRRWNTVIAFGASAAVTIAATATVVAGWHRPSDVVAACLVCLAWTAAVSLVLGISTEPFSLSTLVGSLSGAYLAMIAMVTLGVRPAWGWEGFWPAAIVLGIVATAIAFITTAVTWCAGRP